MCYAFKYHIFIVSNGATKSKNSRVNVFKSNEAIVPMEQLNQILKRGHRMQFETIGGIFLNIVRWDPIAASTEC